jgi:EAL domain-containing protein (putative c-di-GMP-specific phosphodiesterase class I)
VDTGAGYASFAHVLRLRPDVIKLDRSLLMGLHVDSVSRSSVSAIILLARELDATVAAEGVECGPDLEAVTALGVGFAQGYCLAEPSISRAEWLAWQQLDWRTRSTGSGGPRSPSADSG